MNGKPVATPGVTSIASRGTPSNGPELTGPDLSRSVLSGERHPRQQALDGRRSPPAHDTVAPVAETVAFRSFDSAFHNHDEKVDALRGRHTPTCRLSRSTARNSMVDRGRCSIAEAKGSGNDCLAAQIAELDHEVLHVLLPGG
jgi:hypothetical protein